ncbi:hypothetical protein BH23GEM4_BH23GEM4_21140 [soil metagenome]
MRHWQPRELSCPARALLLRALLRYRTPLLRHYPGKPVPQDCCNFFFGPHQWLRSSLPLRSLYDLWDRWPVMKSACPRCGGRILAYTFGMGYEVGALIGCCIHCSHYAVYRVPNGWELYHEARELLDDTPYRLVAINFSGVPGWNQGVLDALEELGAGELAERLTPLADEPSSKEILASRIDCGPAEDAPGV